jgi:hypothetical protein
MVEAMGLKIIASRSFLTKFPENLPSDSKDIQILYT